MDLFEPKKIVFTAQSKSLFYCRMLISKYVFEQKAIPINPFNIWGYFLYELVDRNLVRNANYNLIRISDALWVFGPISDGVLSEIKYSITLEKEIRFFSASSKFENIYPIDLSEIIFEKESNF